MSAAPVSDTPTLSRPGLERFVELRADAIVEVSERFYTTHGSAYTQFGARGRAMCREDLGYHLDFLRPVLEFGLTGPLVDYLRWLSGVLSSRGVPREHLGLSLDWLAEFFAAHMNGADRETVVSALHRTRLRLREPDPSLATIYSAMPARWPECDAFEQALLAGDGRAANAIFDDLLTDGRGLIDTELHVIQPALYAIGQKWESNQVSVAQEHLATAISQSVMTRGLVGTAAPAANGRRALLACVEGNTHAIGLQMVADALQLAGWEVQFLGANVPTRALVKHVAGWKPNLLGLSVSFAHQLHVVREIMAQLVHEFGVARPAVMIGGLAINAFTGLAGQLGVDAWGPDASAAADRAGALPSVGELPDAVR